MIILALAALLVVLGIRAGGDVPLDVFPEFAPSRRTACRKPNDRFCQIATFAALERNVATWSATAYRLYRRELGLVRTR